MNITETLFYIIDKQQMYLMLNIWRRCSQTLIRVRVRLTAHGSGQEKTTLVQIFSKTYET